MEKKENGFVRALVESALMISIGVVLSLFKLVELPQGGSITLASMLPIILVAYRHGLGWGIGSGLAFSLIQMLLGLKNFGYVTGWQSVVAVAVLDYVVAFACAGLGGIYRKPVKNQALALTFGALQTGIIRFVCHTAVGATVWAGLSIPTEAALVYSIGYNASYMIPETIIMALVAFYVGGVIDFRQKDLRMLRKREAIREDVFFWIGSILVIGGLVFAVASVFAELQNPETGDFMITGLQNVNWVLVGIVFSVCMVAGVVMFVLGSAAKEKNREKGTTL